jgi:hypothetical protein
MCVVNKKKKKGKVSFFKKFILFFIYKVVLRFPFLRFSYTSFKKTESQGRNGSGDLKAERRTAQHLTKV